jgi:predicted  nucleic acid-binding Zn-ribbon protein
MLRYMHPAAGQAVIADYNNMVRKLTTKASWSPTWFERQMVLPPTEDPTETQNTGKCKKTIQTNTTNEQEQLLTNYHSQSQQANKVLSKANSSNETQTTDSTMAKDIADLKERNVELMSIISEMKDLQHRDQKKIIGLESELVNTNSKVETGVKKIRECKSAITNVETRLATLSTRAETTSRFDRI